MELFTMIEWLTAKEAERLAGARKFLPEHSTGCQRPVNFGRGYAEGLSPARAQIRKVLAGDTRNILRIKQWVVSHILSAFLLT
jgi:hypothetical protein